MKLIQILSLTLVVSSCALKASKLVEKGDGYFAQKDYLFAERYFLEALASEKKESEFNTSDVKRKLLDSYIAQGKNDKINETYASLIETGEDDYTLEYAQRQLLQKNYDEANVLLKQHLSKNPNDSLAYVLSQFASSRQINQNIECNNNTEKPYRARYSAARSIDQDNPNISFIWSFEDGEIKRGITVVKTYPKAGTYTVKLSSKDNLTGFISEDVAESTLTFEPNPTFKYGNVYGNVRANEESLFEINSAVSNTQYIWDMGDGTFHVGSTVKHNYLSGRSYQLNMYVIQEDIIKGCVTKNIAVLNNFKQK